MEPASRYEIVDTIASGDFAVVYRARDRELGREVAIKQIHQQFLHDPRQLARYWQEAQLLASLQHPHVLTIYDVDRSRGWLILELMQGNLHQRTAGQPIDLDLLRVAMVGCLNALEFLHRNGVIHGDVKPTNMLYDAQNRVVLGDFGLARRASSEEGSLLKGTTKYMAPELVAAQFGPVGPASDLYSLGFSAYELMSGSQFETLFPGLATFGRDKQIAWMMWHAAADRHLPEVGRVLGGVPEDLARVVQRLVVKDQARRYHSAQEVLADLRIDPAAASRLPQEEDPEVMAAKAAAARKKQRTRFVAVLALAFSLVLSLALLLPDNKKPPPPGPPEPTRGVVRSVFDAEEKFVLESDAGGKAVEITIKPHDVITINGKSSVLRDLREGDRAVISEVPSESGHRITKIDVARPLVHQGLIKLVRADEGTFTFTISEGDDKGKDVVVTVPAKLEFTFNGKRQIAGKKIQLADLRQGDHVEIHHLGEETGRKATILAAKRVVTTDGVLRGVDAAKRTIKVALGEGDNPVLVDFPLARECKVTINDLAILDGKALKPADLLVRDKVTLAHDTHVVDIKAYRVLGDDGTIRRVQYGANLLDVVLSEGGRPVTYIVKPECEITLGGDEVTLADLRDGDLVDVRHDSPGARNPEALKILARRPPDPRRWAILVANQTYEDRSLSPLAHPVSDATLLRDALVKRYRVPESQAQTFFDASLVRLRQGIPEWLGQAEAGSKVIVYLAAHAYLDDDGTVYVAPKSFDTQQMATTGLPLPWLVEQFEQCEAEEKLLLLDCSQPGTGTDLRRQPSTAEMMRTLKAPPGRSPLRTVTAIASCRAGQRGQLWAAKSHGLFAWQLAEAYAGRADPNRDGRLEPTELFTFLNQQMTGAGTELAAAQTPELFLPDDRPPRLSEEAKKSIRRLAANLREPRIDLAQVSSQYDLALTLADTEPEPRLLYGLLMLKARERDSAYQHFEELRLDHPELLLAREVMVWARFGRRTYQSGMNELADLLAAVPKPTRPGEPYSERARQIFQWSGRLAEFATTAAEEFRRAPPESLVGVDAAVAAHGAEVQELYRKGREDTRRVVEVFDRKIANPPPGVPAAKLKIDRQQLPRYATFPYESTVERILAGLDE